VFVSVFRDLIEHLAQASEEPPEQNYEFLLKQAKRLFRANRGDLAVVNGDGKLYTKAVLESKHIFPSVLNSRIPPKSDVAHQYGAGQKVPTSSFIWSVWERRNTEDQCRVEPAIDPTNPSGSYIAADSRTRSEIGVILAFPRQPGAQPDAFGVLNLESFRSKYFDSNDAKVLSRFAPYAAAMLLYLERGRSRLREVEQAQNEYQDLLDNVSEGICRTTGDGTYLLVNKAMQEIYGFPSVESLIGTKAQLRYVNPEDRERALESLKTTGRASVEFQGWYGPDRKKQITIRQNVRLRRDSAKPEDLVLDTTLMDVTKEKEMRRRHEIFTGRLAQSQVWAGMVHDAKSPVTEILRRLRKTNAGDATSVVLGAEDAKFIRHECICFLAYAEELARLFKGATPPPSRYCISDLVQSACDRYMEVFRPYAITLEAPKPPGAVYVEGHESLMQRVIENILHNVTVHLVPDCKCSFEVEDDVENATAILRYKDDGPGFSDEYLSDPYSEAVSVNGGGLRVGLICAKSIVEDVEHGKLTLENAPTGGARIVIKLHKAKENV